MSQCLYMERLGSTKEIFKQQLGGMKSKDAHLPAKHTKYYNSSKQNPTEEQVKPEYLEKM